MRKSRKSSPAITVVIPAAPLVEIEVLPSLHLMEKETTPRVERGNNPSRNRNRGAAAAKTQFVAFVNAHSTLSPDWAAKTIDFFARHPEIDMVGGPQLGPPGQGFFERASGYALQSFFGSFGARARYRRMPETIDADETMLTSANLICRRKIMERIQFDELLYPGEDPKFIADVKAAGFRTAYSPEIIAYNRRRASLFPFMKQIFNYGKARPQKETLVETAQRPFFFAPTMFLVYVVALPLLTSIHSFLAIPFFVYLSIASLFAVYESAKNGELPAAPLLLVLFTVMHLSYGAGFIFGLATSLWTRRNVHPMDNH